MAEEKENGVMAHQVSDKAASGASSPWDRATGGTYADKRVPRAVMVAALALSFVTLLLPSVGMLWAATESTTENRALAPAPAFVDEGGAPNIDILADWGAYFDDHFAFRNELVTANAELKALFGTSANDQVVLGRDGWLYYAGTIPDYQRTEPLSGLALECIAHNMRLAQDYVEAHGARFAFAIAPNKNTLYPSHMPYYLPAGEGPSNAERLAPLLQEAGVNYVDLFALLSDIDGEQYLRTDTHWNNLAALAAANALLDSVGKEPLALSPGDAVSRVDFRGDLAAMLYPSDTRREANQYFAGVNDGEGFSGASWRYGEGATVEDDWVVTASADGGSAGSALLFRDSFGNAIVPYWASAFKSAAFSKLVPYDLPVMTQVGADVVVIERAERHLAYLAETPPVAPSPVKRGLNAADWGEPDQDCDITLQAGADGPYLVLEGWLGESCADAEQVYVSVEGADGNERVYEPFWLVGSGGGDAAPERRGYRAYLSSGPGAIEGATVTVCAMGPNNVRSKVFAKIVIE